LPVPPCRRRCETRIQDDHPVLGASLTLKLRENLAPSAERYKALARIAEC
jgi:hypothetical protein